MDRDTFADLDDFCVFFFFKSIYHILQKSSLEITSTDSNVNYDKYVPLTFRTSWIGSLTTLAENICLPIHLQDELDGIHRYASRNTHRKHVSNTIIKQFINKTTIIDQATSETDPEPFHFDYDTVETKVFIKLITALEKSTVTVKKILTLNSYYFMTQQNLKFSPITRIKRPFPINILLCINLIHCNWTRTHTHLVRKRTLNHLAKLASLAKWLSVRLRTRWLWVRVQLQSLKLQISCLLLARSSLTFRQL